MTKVIYIMGVSGSGKSTISQLLSEELKLKFFEGDEFHPTSNIDKMSKGMPLTDDDRVPWLNNLHNLAVKYQFKGCVISCSALKMSYRKRLAHGIEDKIVWIYLKGNYSIILDRMRERENHFMKENMLKSQFDTLEEPDDAIAIDIRLSPELIIQNIKENIL